MIMLFSWIILTGIRLYIDNYKYATLYMSSIHSVVSSILYYDVLKYENHMLYDFIGYTYDKETIKNLLFFSFYYFLFDIFIVKEMMYKLHHILALCALSATMYYNTNLMLVCEYLFYAEYPVILLNYVDYLEKSRLADKYPVYYRICATIHLLLMIHSRIYNLGIIGYNCILYLEYDMCFYIIISVHSIIYIESFKWIYKRGREII